MARKPLVRSCRKAVLSLSTNSSFQQLPPLLLTLHESWQLSLPVTEGLCYLWEYRERHEMFQPQILIDIDDSQMCDPISDFSLEL